MNGDDHFGITYIEKWDLYDPKQDETLFLYMKRRFFFRKIKKNVFAYSYFKTYYMGLRHVWCSTILLFLLQHQQ